MISIACKYTGKFTVVRAGARARAGAGAGAGAVLALAFASHE